MKEDSAIASYPTYPNITGLYIVMQPFFKCEWLFFRLMLSPNFCLFSGLDISAGASDQHCMHKNGTIFSPVKQLEGVVQSKYDLFCSFFLMVLGGETTIKASEKIWLCIGKNVLWKCTVFVAGMRYCMLCVFC